MRSHSGRLDLPCDAIVYLDEVSDARRAPEDDPPVHGDRLVALLLLDRDVSSEEQQRERRHLGAVVQEDLRTRRR